MIVVQVVARVDRFGECCPGGHQDGQDFVTVLQVVPRADGLIVILSDCQGGLSDGPTNQNATNRVRHNSRAQTVQQSLSFRGLLIPLPNFKIQCISM